MITFLLKLHSHILPPTQAANNIQYGILLKEKITISAVPEFLEPTRLDLYLSKRFTYMSRVLWQREIKTGKILLNGSSVLSPNKTVKAGDLISYQGNSREEPPVSRNYSIISEDEHLIAVNKPADLPVHPSGCFFNNTLLMFLEDEKQQKLYPINRIDRETSGIVLFARKSDVVSRFQKALAAGEKTYYVIVHGHSASSEFTVSVPIGTAKDSVIRKKRAAYDGAPESAVTHFKRIKEYENLTLLQAVIETGRQHQIRVHCLYSGLPVVGDKIYGLDENCYLEFIKNGTTQKIISALGFYRSALHCASVVITHPLSGENITLEAPLPADLAELVRL